MLPLGARYVTERSIMAFAGFMVLLSLVLTAFVHHNFMWLTAFVGANLFQSAFTGFARSYGVTQVRREIRG